jgi:hypothetical protein
MAGDQQVRIVGSPSIDLIVDDDLVLGFLQLRDFAELVGLAGKPPSCAVYKRASRRLSGAKLRRIGVRIQKLTLE